MDINFSCNTDGSGIWSNFKKPVKCVKLEIANIISDCGGGKEFAELRVYFDPKTWNVYRNGLIYTDKNFISELRASLNDLCFEPEAIEDIFYSEHGMQGEDYVSFDVCEIFLEAYRFLNAEEFENSSCRMKEDMLKPDQITKEATEAANAAGDVWMNNAKPKFQPVDALTGHRYEPMLDNCGNAHLQFSDKRSKNYKMFVTLGLVRKSGNGVIEINHKFRGRQEHGLHMACAEAAKKVFEKHGITDVRIWDYID